MPEKKGTIETSKKFPCDVKGCTKSYPTKKQLEGHRNANHWKLINPKKRGKPSKKRS